MITLTKEEAQQVLDAFIGMGQRAYDAMSGDAFHECNIAVSRLRARLAQPEPEPVAYINVEKRTLEWVSPMRWETPTVVKMDKVPLYTAPPQREWQGLTMDELSMISDRMKTWNSISLIDVYREIETKLQEKNK